MTEVTDETDLEAAVRFDIFEFLESRGKGWPQEKKEEKKAIPNIIMKTKIKELYAVP